MSAAVEIRKEHVEKIVELLGYGLVSGVGVPEPGKMCVEAMVCYALGLEHGDDPGCVAQSLRRLKIRLNDARWSSNEARAKGLRRLAVAQLGSAGVLDEQEFVRRVIDVTTRKAVPMGLRAAASMKGNATFKDQLEAAAVRCEQEGTREACQAARAVARAYAYADAAADAGEAAAYAAYAAAYARTDRVLAEYAEWIVEILIDLKAPGCQWLTLTPKEAA